MTASQILLDLDGFEEVRWGHVFQKEGQGDDVSGDRPFQSLYYIRDTPILPFDAMTLTIWYSLPDFFTVSP